MIIELPSNLHRLNRRPPRMGFFHFSNNNLSIRRACAREIGMYDPQAIKSEDVDLCFRVALSPRWVACRDDEALVRHKGRRTLSGVIRQMWGWGFYLGYPYAKTGIRGLYAYWLNSHECAITREFELARFPLLVCAFVADFHVAHVLAVVALIAAWMGHAVLATAALAGALAAAFSYLRHVMQSGLRPWATLKLAGVHYLTNVAFNAAGFLGALRHRVLLVPGSVLRPHGSAKR
jgi:hypothetical protein